MANENQFYPYPTTGRQWTFGYPGYIYPYSPGVCPGCGKCNTCGRPNAPYTVRPYWSIQPQGTVVSCST